MCPTRHVCRNLWAQVPGAWSPQLLIFLGRRVKLSAELLQFFLLPLTHDVCQFRHTRQRTGAMTPLQTCGSVRSITLTRVTLLTGRIWMWRQDFF